MAMMTGSGSQRPLVDAQRVVVKLGTGLLTGGVGVLDVDMMAKLVAQIVELHQRGVEVLVVSSGAVAAGRQALEGRADPADNVTLRQALAAVGQSKLMQVYEGLFAASNVSVAQALLTQGDIEDDVHRQNTQNTLRELLRLRVVPIINENDVVAVDELEGVVIGDNDTLSGVVSRLVEADLLVILGEVAGLFSADPNTHKDVQLIPVVEDLDALEAEVGGPLSERARGGMVTKISAARLATAAGTSVVIADGREPDVLTRLLAGESLGTWFPPTHRDASAARGR
jgi:glutamate 5-kinase